MDAALSLQHTERIRSLNTEVHILQAGLFARLAIVLFNLPTLVLGVALIHAVEHRHPIAGLGAALSGMKLHEHVAGVKLAAEERLHADLGEESVRLCAFRKCILECVLLARLVALHLSKLEHHSCVLDRLHKRIERNGVGAFGVRGGDDFLSLRLVVPEIRARLLFFKLCKPLATIFDPDILGHLRDGLLQRIYARPDLLDFKEFLFCWFCHDNYSK